jgi:CspA family cold shock protein
VDGRVPVSLDGSRYPAAQASGRVRRAGRRGEDPAGAHGWAIEERVSKVPTGRVKWYDADKGFGFLAQDGGQDVYVRKAALPAGVAGLKPGQRVEFGMAEGRRGPQALSVRLVDTPPSVVEAVRRPAEELHGLIEDMIRVLETKVQPDLRRGRYPDRRTCKLAAEVVRAVARDLDG